MNIKKIYWILALGGVLTGAPLHAQTIEAVLRSVEQNNKELQAGQYAAEAGKMEVQTQNNLEDPSVEYSPFYADGVTGMASSELVVKQGSRPVMWHAAVRASCSRKSLTASTGFCGRMSCCGPRISVWI